MLRSNNASPGLINAKICASPIFNAAQAEFDAFAFGDVNSWRLQYLHRRAKIVEIVACQGLIFSLAQSGACAAFDRGILLWRVS